MVQLAAECLLEKIVKFVDKESSFNLHNLNLVLQKAKFVDKESIFKHPQFKFTKK
jgi:hypothetical protein